MTPDQMVNLLMIVLAPLIGKWSQKSVNWMKKVSRFKQASPEVKQSMALAVAAVLTTVLPLMHVTLSPEQIASPSHVMTGTVASMLSWVMSMVFHASSKKAS